MKRKTINHNRALYDPLNFDFEPLRCQRVLSIIGKNSRRDNKGHLVCEEVKFLLEHGALRVSVRADTDEIILQHLTPARRSLMPSARWKNLKQWKDYVGGEIGWCWVGRNYMGYADTFMLSFSGIEPDVALAGAASSLWLYEICKV